MRQREHKFNTHHLSFSQSKINMRIYCGFASFIAVWSIPSMCVCLFTKRIHIWWLYIFSFMGTPKSHEPRKNLWLICFVLSERQRLRGIRIYSMEKRENGNEHKWFTVWVLEISLSFLLPLLSFCVCSLCVLSHYRHSIS